MSSPPKTNQDRKHRTHTVIYTIFIVANCGGLLTPLGDPPLFLGMLRGVPFEWTFGLWPYWLFVKEKSRDDKKNPYGLFFCPFILGA